MLARMHFTGRGGGCIFLKPPAAGFLYPPSFTTGRSDFPSKQIVECGVGLGNAAEQDSRESRGVFGYDSNNYGSDALRCRARRGQATGLKLKTGCDESLL